ncbi:MULTISPECIES: glycerophosphodiester phosphodiesterase [unclassified Mesorhizobium]|uniref:glycerophosphodiester phosphodiesterase n=1 Tax=unclassified Mesorhizobium TaxID=325217 RepID=UPI001128FA26|nr:MULTISPECIES: glycerophosphodiester phosphodiesterase [unclassified Mesorhizobium]TPL02155.1 glycerophosphodiester phosphodiesterase [Mesorhizobium sp. B2-4-16]TPL57395.1 glycerophosphodiester phosphodiesterase [Mesorhizobium sp. B2-4-3]
MFDLLPSRSGRILVCGHRGHSVDGHENSRPAFRHAAEFGASLCEIDLRMTRDDRLVVFHDDILDNASSGAGLISQLNHAQIAGFRTKARDDAPIAGQPIEPFEDVLTFCRDLGLGLIVEIKDKFEGTAYLEEVVGLLRQSGMFDRVLISSFDWTRLRDIKRIAPKMRTMGINYHRLVDPAAAARSASMDVMNTDYPQFAPEIADDLHAANIGVSHFLPRPEFFALRRGYGVDYFEELDAYLRAGLIDMLVCDDVGWAVDFVTGCGLKVAELDPAP